MELILPYTIQQLDAYSLLTTRFGTWIVVNSDELEELHHNTISITFRERLLKSRLIITDETYSQFRTDFQHLNANLFYGPTLHIVSVTDRCNQDCTYCHVSAPTAVGVDMTIPTAKKALDIIFSAPNERLMIEFQGGECLINWEVMQYIIEESRKRELISGKKILLTAVSNLTLLTTEKLDYLLTHKVSLCTSLDGPKNVHDHNRPFFDKGRSTYDRVTAGIQLITDQCAKKGIPRPLGSLTTVTKHSLMYPTEIVDEYVARGFPVIHLRNINYLGIAKQLWNEVGYTAEEFITFWKTAFDHIIELNRIGIKIRERTATYMLMKILGFADPQYTMLMNPSGHGRSVLTYEYNGKVYTSDEARMIGEDLFLLGDVNQTYPQLVKNEVLLATLQASTLDNYCHGCAYLPWCGTDPAINYSEQGTLIPKIKETNRHKIYFAQFTYLFEKIISDPTIIPIFSEWLRKEGIIARVDDLKWQLPAITLQSDLPKPELFKTDRT